jgi:predicted dehydrogenase
MSNHLDRRTFMGTAAATGAALSLTSAASAAAVQGANTRLIVAVMGTGGRGTGLATAFQRQANVDVAFVCDVDRARAEAAAAAVSKASGRAAPGVITDYRRILDAKTVDILVVATCNHWHAPAAIMACQAGKHVYVEKPCSYNPREGELLVQAARKHQRKVQMGNQRRSFTGVIAAMDELRKGVIGRPYLAQSWYNNRRPSIGRGKEAAVPKGLDYELWQGPAPRRPFHSNYLHYNWHWFWHWGNGELGNNGIHGLDLCRWGLGVEFPTTVVSSGGRYRFRDDQQTPDTHVANFEFPGGKQITWQGLSCNKHPDSSAFVTFYGDKGALALGMFGDYKVYNADDKLVEDRPDDAKGGSPWLAIDTFHAADFVAKIRSGDHFGVNAQIEKGHRSTLLCHLGNIAYRTQRTLKCDPENGHIQGDEAAMAFWKREYEPGWTPVV